MAIPCAPILVLDSGLGGLTVVKALQAELPGEEIVYFGDTARVPYGSKSESTVTGFVRQIITHFRAIGPKQVVIACNTATALALPTIREEFPELAICGVIEPGAKAAISAAADRDQATIAVIGTEATIRSRAYELAILRRLSRARLMARAAPLLVPIIEDGRDESDPLTQLALRQYLQPLIEQKPDVLVLGCTHYPIFKDLISRMMGSDCAVIDSAGQCAQDVARRLRSAGLLYGAAGENLLRCYVTDDSPKFKMLAERFLGVEVQPPIWISPQSLAADVSPTPMRRAS
jgi:glutamate racemase